MNKEIIQKLQRSRLREPLWKKVIASKYGSRRDIGAPLCITQTHYKGPWVAIAKICGLVDRLYKCKLGNGKNIQFWFDDWAECSFMYQISKESAQRGHCPENVVRESRSWNLIARRNLTDREIEEWASLQQYLSLLKSSIRPDSRIWSLSSCGNFAISSLVSKILTIVILSPLIWSVSYGVLKFLKR